MSGRLPSATLASALIRRVDQAGGNAVVLARGDAQGGGILILALERGENPRFFERGLGPDGRPSLIHTGPESPDPAGQTDYWQRRRQYDPDLWVIEVDIAQAERFAAETIVSG